MSDLKNFRSIGFLIIIFLLAACTVPTPSQPDTPPPDFVTEVPIVTEPPATEVTTDPPGIEAQDLRIVHFDMFDALSGWAVSETAVLRTADGGATWFDVTMPDPPELGFKVGVFFLDMQTAWVLAPDPDNFFFSGMLYHTSDGGESWIANPVPFGGGDFRFLNTTDGWMLAHLGVALGSNAVSVFQTRDGGQTWTRTYTNDPNLEVFAESLPLGGLKYNLVPIDMQTAWVGGVIYAPGTYYFYKSSDGGQTWVPVDMPPASEIENAEVSIDDGPVFISPTTAVLPVRITGESYRTAFYLSADGGMSWQLANIVPGVGSLRVLPGGGIVFFDGELFLVTNDVNSGWTPVAPDMSFTNAFARMDFVDLNTGWVSTYVDEFSRPFYQTIDGGQTWKLLIP